MNVNTYKALQLFLNRQEKLVNKIKLKRESQKDKKNIFRETEKLFNIKQAIIKMYELVLKGANIPTKIEGVIIILDQQNLKGKEGEKYKELKENYKKIVKEIKRLKKESKVSNVPESSSSNKASNDDSDTSSDDNGNSNNGFQEPKSQKKQRERELKRKRENLEAAKKEIEKLNIKLKAFQNQIDKNLEVFINDIENFYKAGKKFTGLDKASLVETEGNKSFVLVDGLNALLALTGQSKKVQEWINEFNNKQEDLNNLIGEIIEEIEQKDLEIARFTL